MNLKHMQSFSTLPYVASKSFDSCNSSPETIPDLTYRTFTTQSIILADMDAGCNIQ